MGVAEGIKNREFYQEFIIAQVKVRPPFANRMVKGEGRELTLVLSTDRR